MNRWRLSASGGGSHGTVAPATATTLVSWRTGFWRWSTQAAGDQNLMTASLVAKNDACTKAGVDTALI
jgi:hypothetical protein